MINFCTCLIEEIHNFYILIKIQKMINSLSKLIYIHVCVQRFVLTNILASQLGPPKPKFLALPLGPVATGHWIEAEPFSLYFLFVSGTPLHVVGVHPLRQFFTLALLVIFLCSIKNFYRSQLKKIKIKTNQQERQRSERMLNEARVHVTCVHQYNLNQTCIRFLLVV